MRSLFVMGLTIVLALVFLSSLPLHASTVWYVSPNGTTSGVGDSWGSSLNHPQLAVDLASPGDEVWVASGTYSPLLAGTGRVLTLRDDFSIYGGFAGTETSKSDRDLTTYSTILDGSGLGGGVVLGASSVTMDGFTITGGYTGSVYEGAGLNADGVTGLRLRNCLFENNSAINGYGGAVIDNAANTTFENVTFKNNFGSTGNVFWESSGILQGCKFEGNRGNYTVGIWTYESSPVIRNTVFSGNYGSGDSPLYASNNSHPVIENTTFYGNNCRKGGSVAAAYGSSLTIRNSILYCNSGPEVYLYSGNTADITYSDVEDGYTGIGNINVAPGLVAPTAGDFRLASNSPCIDAGDPSTTYNDRILPPGQGGARNDLGAYGGPDNLVWLGNAILDAPTDYTVPIERPAIERLGKWNGSTFVPVDKGSITSGNVHVLIHGWQPGYKDWVDNASDALVWNAPNNEGENGPAKYNEFLAASIAKDDPSATILAYSWIDGSATDPIVDDSGNLAPPTYIASTAKQSRLQTDVNGQRLAAAILQACDMGNGFEGKVHFLGHSHGARVATVAAANLQKTGNPIDHLTLMDSPERFGIIKWLAGAQNDLEEELAKLHYGRDADETFIENYFSFFGSRYVDQFGDIVNVKLKPLSGIVDSSISHKYPMEWYAKANNSESDEIGLAWSPLLGTYYQDLDDSYVQDWGFPRDSLRELVLKSETGTIGPNYRKSRPLGMLSVLLQGNVTESGNGVTLVENSPAYWHAVFNVDENDISLEFEYEFLSPGDGDQLGIWIDGELRFIMTGEVAGADLFDSIIDISDLEVGEHIMTVALHSIGDTGASVYVGNFNAVAVPEPSMVLLLALGTLMLLPIRRRQTR